MQPGTHRVHHSYIWLGGLKALLATLVALLVSAAGSVAPAVIGFLESDLTLPLLVFALIAGGALCAVVLLTALFALGFWLSWKNLSYEVGPQEFSLYKGIFSKKRLHVPYQRIQSVDTRASLLQRVAGVCSVEIDTAGGSSNKAIVVPYVTKSDAQELRHELFRRKQIILAGGSIGDDGTAVGAESWQVGTGQAEPSPVTGQVGASSILDDVEGIFSQSHGVFDKASFAEVQPVSFETGLSNKELMLSGISDARNIVGAILLALAGLAGFVLGIEPVTEALANWLGQVVGAPDVASGVTSAAVFKVALRMLPAFVLSLAASIFVVGALSAIAAVLSYGAFKVCRRGTRIEVERGLLQHQTQGIDIDRVQFVRVEHGWIRRKLGYCKVYLGRIDSASNDDGAKNSSPEFSGKGMVVHPFIKTSKLPALLEGLVPELAFDSDVQVEPPARARRRAVVRAALWYNVGFWVLLGLAACVSLVLAAIRLDMPEHWELAREFVFALWPLAALLVADIVVGAVRGFKWHAGSALAYGNGAVCIVNEGFTREEVVVPRKKIQYSCLRANPFQLARHLRSVLVTTAAGSSQTTELIWDIDEADADAFLEWARPKR